MRMTESISVSAALALTNSPQKLTDILPG